MLSNSLSSEEQHTLQSVLAEFMALTQIPRSSKHEQQVNQYLVTWAKENNLQVEQDDYNNVIINKSAAPGYEQAAKIIMQAHTDMVCVSQKGMVYNPLVDPIVTKTDGILLSAVGTSLGADNGIGVAIILHILKNNCLKHGPLRVLFTSDEEQAMTGAKNLAEQHLQADFLINVDGEEAGVLHNSSSDVALYEFVCPVSWVVPQKVSALSFKVEGLRGGHSGMNIHEGRGNALKILAFALATLIDKGLNLQLGNFQGGIAQNAIPSQAEAILVLPESEILLAQQILADYFQTMRMALSHVDSDLNFALTPIVVPDQVLDPKDIRPIVDFLCVAQHGVYTMSQVVPGLVESSANIATLRLEETCWRLQILARSSVKAYTKQLELLYTTLAKNMGFLYELKSYAPGWPINLNSTLVPLTVAAYKKVTGKVLQLKPIHAGLECGYFMEKNPILDIICIGPQIENVHSTSETLHLLTIPNVVNMMLEVLVDLTLIPSKI